MTAWTDFVREYAIRNNVTYMCAIPEAAKEYKKLPKTVKTRKSAKKTPKSAPKTPVSEPKLVDESQEFMRRRYLTV
jgi:hypothetical protein